MSETDEEQHGGQTESQGEEERSHYNRQARLIKPRVPVLRVTKGNSVISIAMPQPPAP